MFVTVLKDYLNLKGGQIVDIADEKTALALIQQGVAEAVKSDPLAPLLAKSYEAMLTGLDQVVDQSIKAALEQAKAKRLPFTPATGEDADPKAGFTNFGEQALAIKAMCRSGTPWDPRQAKLEAGQKAVTGMSEGVGSDGGFLVAPDFSRRIFERLYDDQNLLPRTDGYTTSGNSLTFPRSNETSRANGSRWGGVRAYWQGEGDQGTNVKAGVGRLTLSPHKLMVLIPVTEELLADVGGFGLEQYLLRVASEEIAFVVGDALINGTGAGQPVGMVTAAATVSVAKETGQAAATIVKENVDKMWARLFAPCRRNAVWLINQDIEPQLEALALNVGTGGMPVYLPSGGIADMPNARLKGKPVLPIEWCPTLGTVGDIILADLKQYVTLTKGGVQAAMSMHLRFDYDEMVFKFTFRVDGQTWWNSALTPFKGTATQSCFVTLATRA